LKLTVKDHNYLWYDELIGMYQIDLISIYNKKDHEKYRIWGALRDPLNKEDSGSQGILPYQCIYLYIDIYIYIQRVFLFMYL
jgi:hypothetical protein